MRIAMARKQMTSRIICLLLLLVLTLLFTSGCGSAGRVMTEAKLLSEPEQGKAMVTFIRPGWIGGAITFGIWDNDNLVGVLAQGHSIQYQAFPGEHYFLARSENWSCVKADLEANKHYVIKVNPRMGVWKARVAMVPMTKSYYDKPKQLKQVREWLTTLRPAMPDPQKLETYVEPRRNQVLEAKARFQAGKHKYETLSRQDYLPN